ncbi:MAG: VanZ family protein [Clostridia bacterium]|nr:VanZ family protein [Clostridia bacterium]
MFKSFESLSVGMRALRLVILLGIILNIAFIFFQSSLSTEKATEESDAVKDAISEVVPPDSEIENFTNNNMDKIAHFVEYGMLGFLVSSYIVLFAKNALKTAAFSLLFAETVAVFDETIQIFSGRHPDLKDVWCDILGFVVISLLTYAAKHVLVRLAKGNKVK